MAFEFNAAKMATTGNRDTTGEGFHEYTTDVYLKEKTK